jgi:hypothetical protein
LSILESKFSKVYSGSKVLKAFNFAQGYIDSPQVASFMDFYEDVISNRTPRILAVSLHGVVGMVCDASPRDSHAHSSHCLGSRAEEGKCYIYDRRLQRNSQIVVETDDTSDVWGAEGGDLGESGNFSDSDQNTGATEDRVEEIATRSGSDVESGPAQQPRKKRKVLREDGRPSSNL